MRSVFALVALLVFATAPAQAQEGAVHEIIAAERAFAQDAAARGWIVAFQKAAADDAITLSPDPVNAQANLARLEGPGGTNLDWRPAFAGAAASGDFGFTTGPFQFVGREGIVGHFFTVWRRQADGGWKWIFDAGTDVVDPGPITAMDAKLPTLPAGTNGVGSAERAIAEVAELETNNSRPAALAALLSDDARVNRPFEAPAVGKAIGERLMAGEGGARFMSLRREASGAGDMVFSLGEVRDQHEGAERLRYYARIWQHRPEGWRIVFDEIIPRRG